MTDPVTKMLHICQGNCFCESSGNNFAKAKVLYCYGEVSIIQIKSNKGRVKKNNKCGLKNMLSKCVLGHSKVILDKIFSYKGGGFGPLWALGAPL